MSNIRAKTPAVVAQDFRFAGESSRAIGANGEINASSKKDVLNRSLQLMQAQARGEVVTASAMEERQRIVAQNKELLQAAFDNPGAHRVLGEKMADQLYVTANRKGYARRLMVRHELKQGDIPRFAVRKKNVQAVMLTGPTAINTQIALDKWLTPPELTVGARVFVPQTEINQSNTDVLEEKFIEGLEAIMVTEDRLHYNLTKATIGIDNNLTIITGNLSPLTFMSVRQNVQKWGLKPMYCLMASDLFVDIVGESGFQQAIEPVARHELVMTGELAILYGMTLISEDYRHPEHKVLSQGEFMISSDPMFHGAYSDRGGVDSQPIDTINERIVGRGWLFQESLAMAVANTRSVAWGQRNA
jgi:hypothetical protein